MNDDDEKNKRLQSQFLIANIMGGVVFVTACICQNQMAAHLTLGSRTMLTICIVVMGSAWLWAAVMFNRRTWSVLRQWNETIESWRQSNERMAETLSPSRGPMTPLTETRTYEMSRNDITVALMDWVHNKRMPNISGKWHGEIFMSLDGTAKVVVAPGHLKDDVHPISMTSVTKNRGTEKPN